MLDSHNFAANREFPSCKFSFRDFANRYCVCPNDLYNPPVKDLKSERHLTETKSATNATNLDTYSLASWNKVRNTFQKNFFSVFTWGYASDTPTDQEPSESSNEEDKLDGEWFKILPIHSIQTNRVVLCPFFSKLVPVSLLPKINLLEDHDIENLDELKNKHEKSKKLDTRKNNFTNSKDSINRKKKCNKSRSSDIKQNEFEETENSDTTKNSCKKFGTSNSTENKCEKIKYIKTSSISGIAPEQKVRKPNMSSTCRSPDILSRSETFFNTDMTKAENIPQRESSLFSENGNYEYKNKTRNLHNVSSSNLGTFDVSLHQNSCDINTICSRVGNEILQHSTSVPSPSETFEASKLSTVTDTTSVVNEDVQSVKVIPDARIRRKKYQFVQPYINDWSFNSSGTENSTIGKLTPEDILNSIVQSDTDKAKLTHGFYSEYSGFLERKGRFGLRRKTYFIRLTKLSLNFYINQYASKPEDTLDFYMQSWLVRGKENTGIILSVEGGQGQVVLRVDPLLSISRDTWLEKITEHLEIAKRFRDYSKAHKKLVKFT